MWATPAGLKSAIGSRRNASNSASVRQRNSGVEWPTPRGSMPTKSNRRKISVSASDAPMLATVSTADAPGPPGLTTSTPIFSPVAGTRITANCAWAPSGLAGLLQSTGTDTVPHCAVGIGVVSPTKRSQLPHTGGWPYCWIDSPSGEAQAAGHAIADTTEIASSTVYTLPTRHMAVMFAWLTVAGLRLEHNGDLAVIRRLARS